GTGILPVAQKVEQASCLLLKRWNRHFACCSKGGTGILPVAQKVEQASCLLLYFTMLSLTELARSTNLFATFGAS
ncbi:hypothetical protein, partial [Microcoleus sp. B4-C1]|uniref:hypothetical protein n=1 Tax=Microcoleus sp. B4-C1 TaxID=2818660 RepID=UPI002FD4BC3D